MNQQNNSKFKAKKIRKIFVTPAPPVTNTQTDKTVLSCP